MSQIIDPPIASHLSITIYKTSPSYFRIISTIWDMVHYRMLNLKQIENLMSTLVELTFLGKKSLYFDFFGVVKHPVFDIFSDFKMYSN